MTFPRFEGEEPRIWKDKCLDYFSLFELPRSLWATMSSLGMDGRASKWLQIYKQKYGISDWDTFIQAVEKKFGDNDYREALTMLLELQQIDTLDTYISAFEDLQYKLMMHNTGFDDLFFVTQFIKGLKLDIACVVQSHIPETMERAILLAKIQQQVLDKNKGKGQQKQHTSKVGQIQQKVEGKYNATSNTLWKERQLRDFRKANGLCFYCGENFDANHKNVCTKKPRQQPSLNALVVNDLDTVLLDEVLAQLKLEDKLTEGFCQLSLNAIAGTEHGEAMKIRAIVKNKVMLMLIDSGSSHSFVSKSFVEHVGIPTIPVPAKQVKVANGELMITDQCVPHLEWWTNGYTLGHEM